MSIELGVLLSVVSCVIGMVVGINGMIRTKTNLERKEAEEHATVIIKLETISTGILEIKSEMRSAKEEIQQLRDRLTVVEQSAKSFHKRLDDCKCNHQDEQ